jgi:hypothetical protein
LGVGQSGRWIAQAKDIDAHRGHERMSKLVVPPDLSCFATCERAAQSVADGPQTGTDSASTDCWCVPEAWKACCKCRDLIKAGVAIPSKPIPSSE